MNDDRMTTLGLWTVPGIGSGTVNHLRRQVQHLGNLAHLPPSEWWHLDGLSAHAKCELAAAPKLTLWQRGERAASAYNRVKIAFEGDPAYPDRLLEVHDRPPLLFHFGPGASAAPRRRLAMIGSRKVEDSFKEVAAQFAESVASMGVGVVSGAAAGIDSVCHLGALAVKGETWAFLGSAIDQMDAGPRALWHQFEDQGGTMYSEYPPGVRASRDSFPRRNRLITGSSDAVLVLRARKPSGTEFSVEYAVAQGRPVLAIPGEVGNETAAYCNEIIADGTAAACLTATQAVRATGATGFVSHQPLSPTVPQTPLERLSADARTVYGVLEREAAEYEAIEKVAGLGSGNLISALTELEISGWVIQRAGRRFERL